MRASVRGGISRLLLLEVIDAELSEAASWLHVVGSRGGGAGGTSECLVALQLIRLGRSRSARADRLDPAVLTGADALVSAALASEGFVDGMERLRGLRAGGAILSRCLMAGIRGSRPPPLWAKKRPISGCGSEERRPSGRVLAAKISARRRSRHHSRHNLI